jgi:hypothetical protein
VNVSHTHPKDQQVSVANAEERVVLYPTFGRLSADQREWQVEVSGHVARPAAEGLRRRMAVRMLERLFGTRPAEAETTRFRERLDPFFETSTRGRRLSVGVGDQFLPLLNTTCRGGHFRETIRIPSDTAQSLCLPWARDEDWLAIRVVSQTGNARVPGSVAEGAPIAEGGPEAEGAVQLIGPSGLSVISDIDDTIKRSEVADKRQLLRNTFLHEYEAVEGMADAYRAWAGAGAAFHYVSSSPWQLFSSLWRFLEEAGFPRGSFHLRTVRVYGPGLLRLFTSRRTIKSRWIRSIFRQFPGRTFILVGDSGEKDPEIYGGIAREFPGQVSRIFVRRVPGQPACQERLERAFRGLDRRCWQLVEDPREMLADCWSRALEISAAGSDASEAR